MRSIGVILILGVLMLMNAYYMNNFYETEYIRIYENSTPEVIDFCSDTWCATYDKQSNDLKVYHETEVIQTNFYDHSSTSNDKLVGEVKSLLRYIVNNH